MQSKTARSRFTTGKNRRRICIHKHPDTPQRSETTGHDVGRWPYIDTILPFGLRSALQVFSATAGPIEWIALYAGLSVLLHYLDDFLTMGKKSTPEWSYNLELLIHLCSQLGIPLKLQKLEAPSTVLTF